MLSLIYYNFSGGDLIDITQLRYFLAVSRLEHITKAAELLHITQPALTASMHRLETELGVQLFVKKGRNIRLTEYGREFLRYADTAVSSIEKGQQALRSIQERSLSRVTLIAPSMRPFPGLLENLFSSCPQLSITNVGDNPTEIIRILSAGEADLCLTVSIPTSSSFESCPLVEEEVIILATADHPLLPNDTVFFSELQNIPFVSSPRGNGPRAELEYICQKKGFTPSIVFETSALPEIVGMVHTGRCIAMLTRRTAENYLYMYDNLRMIRVLDDDFCLTRRLIWRTDIHTKPMACQARQIIFDYFHISPAQ